ncbi:hypothetical protein MKQ70_30470 [Chitinophaga sedimenti]|nr:hypothetical protein [Chitinophaga sedimenti]MCK7559069.1 hypothetical protein [Chitinophaga sedimenti]
MFDGNRVFRFDLTFHGGVHDMHITRLCTYIQHFREQAAPILNMLMA